MSDATLEQAKALVESLTTTNAVAAGRTRELEAELRQVRAVEAAKAAKVAAVEAELRQTQALLKERATQAIEIERLQAEAGRSDAALVRVTAAADDLIRAVCGALLHAQEAGTTKVAPVRAHMRASQMDEGDSSVEQRQAVLAANFEAAVLALDASGAVVTGMVSSVRALAEPLASFRKAVSIASNLERPQSPPPAEPAPLPVGLASPGRTWRERARLQRRKEEEADSQEGESSPVNEEEKADSQVREGVIEPWQLRRPRVSARVSSWESRTHTAVGNASGGSGSGGSGGGGGGGGSDGAGTGIALANGVARQRVEGEGGSAPNLTATVAVTLTLILTLTLTLTIYPHLHPHPHPHP